MKLRSYVFRSLFGTFARLGWCAPFVMILERTVREHPASRRHGGPERPTLLGLSPEHFRRDLDILAKSGKFRVLLMPTRWQTRLMYLFFPEGRKNWEYQNPPTNGALMKDKRRLQAFYRRLVPRVHAALGVDAVVSHHLRAPADVDWGIVSKETGYPYLVLYREGMFASAPEIKRRLEPRLKRLGFWASRLIVHNKSGRDFCIEIGLTPAEKVSALGCLRMDALVRRLAATVEERRGRRKVACFPTLVSGEGSLLDGSFDGFFRDAHLPLVQLARDNPDVDVIFKPKPKVADGFRRDLQHMVAEAGMRVQDLGNVLIDSDWDAQDLIMAADVICGINSTTILEAALTPKPVVVPFFSDLRQGPKRDRIKFADGLESLDTATDAADFRRLVERGLKGRRPDSDEMAKRRQIFAKYVSDPDGCALSRYEAVIMDEIEKARRTRGVMPRCGNGDPNSATQ